MWQVKNEFIWLNRFAVFWISEYCLHDYNLTVTVQFRFYFSLSQLKIHCFFTINSISCFKFSSASLDQWNLKLKFLEYLPWLNCCFSKFYYADTKDTVFVLFLISYLVLFALICMNYIQLLFVLIILEV